MKTPCYVYIIHQATTNYIKIGIAENTSQRLKDLQTASPLPLHLKYSLPCKDRNSAIAIESYLHQRYEKQRMSGEWFDVAVDETIDFLKVAAFLAKYLQPVVEVIDTKTVEVEKIVKVPVSVIQKVEVEKPYYINPVKGYRSPFLPLFLMLWGACLVGVYRFDGWVILPDWCYIVAGVIAVLTIPLMIWNAHREHSMLMDIAKAPEPDKA